MNPQDPNLYPLFFLLGVPLIIMFGGPYGWRALLILAVLAGLAAYPLITGAALILYCLRTPIRWAIEAWIFGYAAGKGVAASHVLDRPIARRSLRDLWRRRD